MHGRLKVKTSAEQQEEKRKEREKKLEAFKKGCAIVEEKKRKEEYDKEALTVLSSLLQANPDYYTLWNFRKKILVHLKDLGNEEEITELVLEEMSLTESCLRKNPKSYGAWHHRLWSLKLAPDPNWKQEIRLCDKYLELDERNFHCWDHRRAVCSFITDANPKEELRFTMTKIEANFSNYSAWHYRSSLLPRVHPATDKKGFIDEGTLLSEYELVQNAAFTDPCDQSAWFYHRWLLGREEKSLGFHYVHASLSQNILIVVFTKPVLLGSGFSIELRIDNKKINTHWENPLGNNYASSVWVCRGLPSVVKETSTLIVGFENGDVGDSVEIRCEEEIIKWRKEDRKNIYNSDLSFATQQILERELESCSQLMEMEPENKWTILTCALLMQALDSQTHQTKVSGYLTRLTALDPMRRNYYCDLKSRFLVENAIERLSPCQQIMDLSRLGLTYVPHLDHLAMIKELDLSGNSISSLKQFKFLICLEKLVVDNNSIEDCCGLQGLVYLLHLSIQNNGLSSVEKLSPLVSCVKLKSLKLEGNPICEDKEAVIEIRNMLAIANVTT